MVGLYHNRWQIELFFKWLRQHLKIKKFWGETENDIRIQIYIAITAYCMMAIEQKRWGQAVNRDLATHKHFTYKDYHPQKTFLKDLTSILSMS